MSRASSHALKHPPVTAPSEPAGATPFPELAVAIESQRRRGRGAQSNQSGRFEAEARVAFDDGWQSPDELPPFKTTVSLDPSRKVITRNDSPDIGFDRSINPYRGCEHGCVYCFARPTHAFLGLSPGLDFESKLLAKPDAPELLEKELAASGYEPRMIAIGTNTDPYQPIEREHKIMRGILEVLDRAGHPVGIVTKSALVTRDMRGGRDYDSQWGTRMKGTGPMAWMIGRRFEIACAKLGLNKRRSKLTTDHFVKPKRSGQQLSLF